MKPRLLTFTLTLLLALVPAASFAYDERPASNTQGLEVFTVRFFDVGDGQYMSDEGDSTWTLTEAQKRKVLGAVSYWSEIIRPRPGFTPAIVNVGTFEGANAWGYSKSLLNDSTDIQYTQFNVQLNYDDVPSTFLDTHAHGQFSMGKLDYEPQNVVPPSVIPLTGAVDLQAVAFHELAHGLGITSSITDIDPTPGKYTPHFGDKLNIWDTFLRDDNGNAARPGQAILCTGCDNAYSAEAFNVSANKAYFVGRNVSEVMEGAMPGVPVTVYGLYPDGTIAGIDRNYLAHLELRHSLMSHQSYRNYTNFLEAELAVLQDLGYSIDRRQFYGRSVYGDGLTIVNDRGYFQRNLEGTAYLPGQYNATERGIGLHVYGSRNTLIQTADILSAGPGAAGVRIDGTTNTLIIDGATRIHSNGYYGQGIIFAYGRSHRLVHRGNIEALGEGGVGLRFDFGTNTLGSLAGQDRGSYIFTRSGAPAPLLDELNGPLVDRADITGRVAGRRAAIYIADNALVGQVNIMRGAVIEGDILSAYAQSDADDNYRLTTISFGQQPDASGVGTGGADPDFKLRHDGNIVGPTNLTLSIDGGYTSLNGTHQVVGVSIKPGATLAGSSRYELNTTSANCTLPGGCPSVFKNEGTLAPGNSPGSIFIGGDYVQTSTGRLDMEVSSAGFLDTLTVSGNASLDGTLGIILTPDWYSSSWQLPTTNIVQTTGTISGQFARAVAETNSPTLRLNTLLGAGGQIALSISRPGNAYQRWGASDTGRSTGAALDQIATLPNDETGLVAMRPLFQGLDFSGADGSNLQRALEQLSPATYNTVPAALIRRERSLAMSSLSQAWLNGPTTPNTWQAWLTPYGAGAWQSGTNDTVGYKADEYGVTFGARRSLTGQPHIQFAAQADLAHQVLHGKAPYTSRTKAISGGISLSANYQPNHRTGPMAYAGLRFGLDRSRLERDVQAGGYQARHRAQWTGYSTSATAASAYQWALTPAWSAGPVAVLNYARIHRPELSESGNDASRLGLKSSQVDALSSSVGLRARYETVRPSSKAARLVANVQVTWDREWLSQTVKQEAYFASVPGVSMTSSNRLLSRDALSLRTGLTYQADDRLNVGLELAGQLLGSGYESINASLNLNWRF